MAVGLEVLKKRKVLGLKNCDSTINFCIKFNEMFDALNRKVPFQGVHPDTNDYKVRSDIKYIDSLMLLYIYVFHGSNFIFLLCDFVNLVQGRIFACSC